MDDQWTETNVDLNDERTLDIFIQFNEAYKQFIPVQGTEDKYDSKTVELLLWHFTQMVFKHQAIAGRWIRAVAKRNGYSLSK